MSVRKSVFWAFTGQFVSFVTGLGSSIIIARLLTPHEMGIYAVAFAVLGVLQIIAAFDMATYVVRAKELGPRTLDAAFTVNAALSLGLAAVTLVISFAGAALMGEPAIARALQWLAVAPILSIIETPAAGDAAARRAVSPDLAGHRRPDGGLGRGQHRCGLCGSELYEPRLRQPRLCVAFGAIVFSIVAREHVSLRPSFENWRAMSAFGLRMMSITGLANLVNRFTDIVLGRMLGLAALGLYSRASGISALLFQNVYGTATKVVFVQLAKAYRERGVLRDTFLRGIQMITAVMWPLLIGLAVLARPVVLLLFCERWLAAANPLSLLLIAQFVVLGFGMNWELFVLRDETARQTRFEAVRAIVSLVLFVIGCTISIAAAAASRIVEALAGLLLYLPHMNRLAGTTTGDLFKIYVQSVLLTVVAVLPSTALMVSSGWSPQASGSMIAAAVSLGILLWFGGLALLRHPLLDEIAVLVRWVRRRA